MKPDKLTVFMEKKGKLESHKTGLVFHSPDFTEKMFMLKSGYVKRYQVTKDNNRIIELIYGPGHIFPLSQLYKMIFGIEQNQQDLVYVYQAMTDIKVISVCDEVILSELEKVPELYIDLYYESGLRLKSNIDRLASNAIKDEYKKVAHQIFCLAEEFGEVIKRKGEQAIKIAVPLEPIDMAEQLNISVEVADAVMSSLSKNKLLATDGNHLIVTDINLLKDVYL